MIDIDKFCSNIMFYSPVAMVIVFVVVVIIGIFQSI